jgi:hypothetical protein
MGSLHSCNTISFVFFVLHIIYMVLCCVVLCCIV